MREADQGEFAEFAGAVARELRATAFLMCCDWHRAEDAAQEALMRLYVAWPRLERGTGLRRYARKAVVSAVLDQGKRHGAENGRSTTYRP